MPLFVQFALQILLPAFLLVDLFRTKYRRRRAWAFDVVWMAAVLGFVFLTARWDAFSYYLRILLFPAFGLIAYVAFRCIDRQKEPMPEPRPVKQFVDYAWKGLVLAMALVLNVQVVLGLFPPSETIDLAYPLRNGVYYVGGGGGVRWINNHQAFPPQDHALDIVRLNAFGNRARGLQPEALGSYAIYGDPVYCPCSGIVARAVDGIADLPPPQRTPEQLAGNHVVIACNGVDVLLAHLATGSIEVEEGASVEEGDVLAKVGNSGNTSQPHLHIHAERGGVPGQILTGEGVAIRFHGRYLARNSLFTGRVKPTR